MLYIRRNLIRRGGRAVYCTGLENRRPARVRGFESHPLRHERADKLVAPLTYTRSQKDILQQIAMRC
jgi:hypothetical protein